MLCTNNLPMSTTYLTLFLLFYPLLPITHVFCLLVTGFESAEVLFFGTTLGVLAPFLPIPCEWWFPRIKYLIFNGCLRNEIKSFLLLMASSCFVELPHFLPLYHHVWLLLRLIAGRRTITLQFSSVSWCCLSTNLLRGFAVVKQHRLALTRSFEKGLLRPDITALG